MQTAWCLAVAFVALFLVGAPLAWLARRGRAMRATDWLWCPFGGIAAVVCVLQPLVVFADLPLRRTAPWLWGTVLLLWAAMLTVPAGRASIRAAPWRVLLLALAAYLAEGSQVVRRGVAEYRGNLLSDQYNYVVLAQFLTDVPYSTNAEYAQEQPWTGLPIALKADRLGQSVFHGFLAVSAGRDCLDLFFPTALLSPALIVPAMRLLLSHFRLFGTAANASAVVAALLPGAASIVADCYLSHALFVPILFAYTAAILKAARRPAMLGVAGILLASAFMVYTEFTPLLLGVTVVVAFTAKLTGRVSSLRAIALLVAPVAVAAALTPAAWESLIVIAGRSRGMGTQITYPVALWRVAEQVWLDMVRVQVTPGRRWAVVAGAFTIACYAFSLAGWARAATDAWRRGRVVPPAAAFALMLLPVAVLVASPNARYAFFKLLMTVSPLFAVGLGLCAAGGPRPAVGGWWRARRLVVGGLAVLLVLDTLVYDVATQRPDTKDVYGRWHDPGLRQVIARLNEEPRELVIVDLGEDEHSWLPAGAIMYESRHHRIRLLSPHRVWFEPLERANVPAATAGDVRPGALIVTSPDSAWAGRGEVLVRTNRYLLVRVNDRPQPAQQ
jgi:hypothetical protein